MWILINVGGVVFLMSDSDCSCHYSDCKHFFVQVPSLTGLTADCFPSPFTLRSAALCAENTKTPILTLRLTQLSSGNDDVHSEFLFP